MIRGRHRLICRGCSTISHPDASRWRCPCGGLFDLVSVPAAFPREAIARRLPTLWRYEEALARGLDDPVVASITMGEGMTPLVRWPIAPYDVRLKLDFLMPTLSYKDRGAAMLVAHAVDVGARELVADSSGNAGTSIGAYAARAGLPCTVFVRAATSPKKLAQLRAHGATVVEVPGTREDVAAAARAAATSRSAFYASHVYNPYFLEGTKTAGFEIWEQLGWSAPEVVVVPVGNGTLVLGVALAFEELLAAGEIDRLPMLIAVQAAACAPIAAAYAAGSSVAPVENRGTIAEGIAIAAPARGDQIVEAIKRCGGAIVTVEDDAVVAARDDLAEHGIYVEPTSAAPWAALAQLRASDRLPRTGPIVVPITGAGLKAG